MSTTCGNSSGNSRSKTSQQCLNHKTKKFKEIIKALQNKSITIKVEILRVKGKIFTGRNEKSERKGYAVNAKLSTKRKRRRFEHMRCFLLVQ